MRKTIYFMALVLLAGLSAGVVGHDCPPGQMCIQSGNDSSGFEAVEKNGTDWNSTLTVEDASPSSNISERLVNSTYSQENGSYQVRFDGVMKVNSPCYKPVYSVSSDGNSYSMNVSAEKEENATCTQVITEIDYTMEFESGSAFKLEVSQDNIWDWKIAETFTHPDYSENNQDGSSEEDNTNEPESQEQGLIAGFFSWLGSIF